MSSVMELLLLGINATFAANLSQLPALITHEEARGHLFFKEIIFFCFYCPLQLWEALQRGVSLCKENPLRTSFFMFPITQNVNGLVM